MGKILCLQTKDNALKITIIGWYGTETIGDRAVLAGILNMILRQGEVDEIFLGSLFPFFTERTLFEDRSFWKNVLRMDPRVSIFDSRMSGELEAHINRSDLVVVGGGPLLHIDPMYMLAYAFKYAKRKGVKTIIMGSGVGPIFKKKFKKILVQLFQFSDRVILRDPVSLENIREIYEELGQPLDETNISVSVDPAIAPCLKYKSEYQDAESVSQGDGLTVGVSLRRF